MTLTRKKGGSGVAAGYRKEAGAVPACPPSTCLESRLNAFASRFCQCLPRGYVHNVMMSLPHHVRDISPPPGRTPKSPCQQGNRTWQPYLLIMRKSSGLCRTKTPTPNYERIYLSFATDLPFNVYYALLTCFQDDLHSTALN